MSQLLIKQRVFSWSDSYDVYDENSQPKYFVKADFFSLGKSIHVYDKRTEQEVGYIKQKLLVLLQEYDIYLNGMPQGKVKRKLSLFKPQFDIEYRGWQVVGDFLGLNYQGLENGQTVFSIQKKLLSWGDTYVLTTARDEDELLALLMNIAIDAACHDDSGSSS